MHGIRALMRFLDCCCLRPCIDRLTRTLISSRLRGKGLSVYVYAYSNAFDALSAI